MLNDLCIIITQQREKTRNILKILSYLSPLTSAESHFRLKTYPFHLLLQGLLFWMS